MFAAEICFYGNRDSGFDFLALTAAGFTAESQPSPEVLRFDSITDAFFRAVKSLEAADVGPDTEVAVFMPGGDRMARFVLAEPPMGVGSLKTEPAPVYTISAEAIEKYGKEPF